jgi:predicted ATP-dependent endonuclease of OLD family
MRLAYLKLNGFKRFKEATVNLDRTLIAFIGPNEAGKSSIFQALIHMEDREPISKKELTRGIQFQDDDDIIEIVFFIEEDDLRKIGEYNGIGEPTLYHRIKPVSGEVHYKLNSKIERDISLRMQASILLETILDKGLYDSKLKQIIDEESEDETDEKTLYDQSIDLVKILNLKDESLSENQILEIENFHHQLDDLLEILPKSKKSKVDKLSSLLSSLIPLEKQEHPSKRFEDYLFSTKPQFAFFDQSNRELNETYSNEEINNPPIALFNIFKIAELDYEKLYEEILDDDSGEVEAMLVNANKNLQITYNKYWNQDNVYPRIKLENDGLRILIKSVDRFNNLSDRSDGIKQFITLLAFALNNKVGNNIILLIDEAEIHLHYNAQVDIVKLFEEQQIVNSIFYSTHSAGCLPSDLGTGIRSVQQIIENSQVTKYSRIRNSVWQNNSGFTPILMALGASMLSINLTRKALLAEGETEPIILPRLFREASGLDNLDFQIGPGLASISTERCKELESEAAKVLFFVDGDSGGTGIKNKLINGKISRSKIFNLPKGTMVEDFIKKEKLLDAVNDILFNFQKDKLTISASKLPDKNSVGFLENECNKAKLKFPSKVLIIEKIVMVNSQEEIIKNSKKKILKGLLDRINIKFNDL